MVTDIIKSTFNKIYPMKNILYYVCKHNQIDFIANMKF